MTTEPSLEEIITARARERRVVRELDSTKIIEEGYRVGEAETVLQLRTRMQGWSVNAETSALVASMRKKWSDRLEAEGKEPRTYRYFHTINGSTLPKLKEGESYKENPDLADDDSIFVLADAIDAAITQQQAVNLQR